MAYVSISLILKLGGAAHSLGILTLGILTSFQVGCEKLGVDTVESSTGHHYLGMGHPDCNLAVTMRLTSK